MDSMRTPLDFAQVATSPKPPPKLLCDTKGLDLQRQGDLKAVGKRDPPVPGMTMPLVCPMQVPLIEPGGQLGLQVWTSQYLVHSKVYGLNRVGQAWVTDRGSSLRCRMTHDAPLAALTAKRRRGSYAAALLQRWCWCRSMEPHLWYGVAAKAGEQCVKPSR